MYNTVVDTASVGERHGRGNETKEELEEILIAHPDAEFVQLQINYADGDNPAIQSRGVYEVARKYGKPIVVMEPLKGGLLANPPEQVTNILKDYAPEMSTASWGIRFAANLEGVLVVLSGMSDASQMDDNISYMKDFKGLAADEEACLMKARDELARIPLIPCTTCNYCAKVCPMEIGISGSFTAKNIYTLFNNLERAKLQENWLVKGQGRKQAAECIKCGKCEQVCPQHIKIREELAVIAVWGL